MLNFAWFTKWGNVLIILFLVIVFVISTLINFTTVSKFQVVSINGGNLIGKINFRSQHLPVFKHIELDEKSGVKIEGKFDFIKKINDTSALIYITLIQKGNKYDISKINLLVNTRSLYDIINISNIYRKPIK